MESGRVLLMISIGCLILLSAFFSATETAFTSFNRVRLKNLAEDGNQRAAKVLALADNYDKLLSTILIGNNIVNIASASLATVLFTLSFGDAGVTISTAAMTVLVLIFGEISPKSLAKDAPEKFAMFAEPIIHAFLVVLTPVNFLFTQWKKLLSKLFRVSAKQGVTEGELMTMVDEVENEGVIDEHEGELIRSAIEFNDLEAEDILTPRVDIVAVEEQDTMQEIAEVFDANGFSRLPVFRDTVDQIVGVIHEKDFSRLYRSGKTDLQEIMQKVVCVPEHMKISHLLRQLQQEKIHIAVVVDEFGGTSGIVTLEDILEELVGEIWDEHDEVVEEFCKVGAHEYRISCSASLEDLFELFQIEDDETDSSTVSGWVIEQLGKLPQVGDRFTYERLEVEVTKTEARRAVEIRVKVLEEEPRME